MDNIDYKTAERIFTVKKNQIKMIQRRGYTVKKRESDLLKISLDSFLEVYIPFAEQQKQSLRSVLSRPYEHADDDSRIYVYFADQSKTSKQLGVDVVSDVIATADQYRAKKIVLITPSPLTPSASKKIQDLLSYTVSVFLETEMVYDPTEHYFTPEHRALETEEQREFLKRNNLSIDQLPIILTTDMISRYYGFRPGQVIEIKRVNMFVTMVQESLGYRVVKEDV